VLKGGLEGKRGLVLVLALAIAIRLAFFLVARPWDEAVVASRVVTGDSIEYNGIASNILRDFDFRSSYEWRCPGYPAFLAAIYGIFGIKPWLVVLVQLLLGVASVALVYAVGMEILGPGAALLGSLVYTLDFATVQNILPHLPDTLLVTLLLGSVWMLLRGVRRDRMMDLVFGGILFGLAALVKPIAQYLPVLAVPWILFFSGRGWKRAMAMALVLCFFFALTVLPWVGRNFALYGHASMSAQPWYSMLYYNVALTEMARTGKTYDQVKGELSELAGREGVNGIENPYSQAELYKKMAVRYIRNHPLPFAIENAKGVVRMFTNTNLGKTTLLGMAVAISLALGYLLASVGALRLIQSGEYAALALLSGVPLYFTMLTGVIGGSRYRLPLMPFISLLGGVALTGLFSSAAGRWAKRKSSSS
jgi:4-amino-4-deoxy-L-arabinose transferase-like glycosyltransferase